MALPASTRQFDFLAPDPQFHQVAPTGSRPAPLLIPPSSGSAVRAIKSGHFGADIHKPSTRREEVGHDSAGCQVIQNPEDFRDFMAACQRAATHWGNRFTYTLLEERDLG